MIKPEALRQPAGHFQTITGPMAQAPQAYWYSDIPQSHYPPSVFPPMLGPPRTQQSPTANEGVLASFPPGMVYPQSAGPPPSLPPPIMSREYATLQTGEPVMYGGAESYDQFFHPPLLLDTIVEEDEQPSGTKLPTRGFRSTEKMRRVAMSGGRKKTADGRGRTNLSLDPYSKKEVLSELFTRNLTTKERLHKKEASLEKWWHRDSSKKYKKKSLWASYLQATEGERSRRSDTIRVHSLVGGQSLSKVETSSFLKSELEHEKQLRNQLQEEIKLLKVETIKLKQLERRHSGSKKQRSWDIGYPDRLLLGEGDLRIRSAQSKKMAELETIVASCSNETIESEILRLKQELKDKRAVSMSGPRPATHSSSDLRVQNQYLKREWQLLKREVEHMDRELKFYERQSVQRDLYQLEKKIRKANEIVFKLHSEKSSRESSFSPLFADPPQNLEDDQFPSDINKLLQEGGQELEELQALNKMENERLNQREERLLELEVKRMKKLFDKTLKKEQSLQLKQVEEFADSEVHALQKENQELAAEIQRVRYQRRGGHP